MQGVRRQRHRMRRAAEHAAVCARDGRRRRYLDRLRGGLVADAAELIECVGEQPVWSDLPDHRAVALGPRVRGARRRSSRARQRERRRAAGPHLDARQLGALRPSRARPAVPGARASRAAGAAQRSSARPSSAIGSLVENITDYAIFMIGRRGPRQRAGTAARRSHARLHGARSSRPTDATCSSPPEDVEAHRRAKSRRPAARAAPPARLAGAQGCGRACSSKAS